MPYDAALKTSISTTYVGQYFITVGDNTATGAKPFINPDEGPPQKPDIGRNVNKTIASDKRSTRH